MILAYKSLNKTGGAPLCNANGAKESAAQSRPHMAGGLGGGR